MKSNMRLDAYLSKRTTFTRKEIHHLIKNKQVKINGQIILKNNELVNEQDQVYINDILLPNSPFIYLVLNKPNGYVCSHNQHDGKNVFELVPKHKNLSMVGRLDKDTTGLLLFSNDGNFIHMLKSPKFEISKKYELTLLKPLDQKMLERLQQPITLDNKLLKPFILNSIDDRKWIITIQEGKYHQIKRIFKLVNNEVISLNRIAIGKIRLEKMDLKIGEWKYINKDDVI